MSADPRHVRTARLHLDEPREEDADDLLAIHADPALWRHFPSGRVTDPAAGAVMVEASRRRFERDDVHRAEVAAMGCDADGFVR